MHRLIKVNNIIGFKMGITFWDIWQKWYPNFTFVSSIIKKDLKLFCIMYKE
jgi:hypothetical protein